MAARLSLDDIERLYAERGGLAYGEGVSQIEHALQCAVLAQADGAAPSLIVAALLHDVGHLFEDDVDETRLTIDDRHETAGARALAGLFDEAVRAPIALHVAAKRYLCFK
jgi:predicted HD phosphohydrolase